MRAMASVHMGARGLGRSAVAARAGALARSDLHALPCSRGGHAIEDSLMDMVETPMKKRLAGRFETGRQGIRMHKQRCRLPSRQARVRMDGRHSEDAAQGADRVAMSIRGVKEGGWCLSQRGRVRFRGHDEAASAIPQL